MPPQGGGIFFFWGIWQSRAQGFTGGGLSPRCRSSPRLFLAECGVHCDVLGTTAVSWPFFLGDPETFFKGGGRGGKHCTTPTAPPALEHSPPLRSSSQHTGVPPGIGAPQGGPCPRSAGGLAPCPESPSWVALGPCGREAALPLGRMLVISEGVSRVMLVWASPALHITPPPMLGLSMGPHASSPGFPPPYPLGKPREGEAAVTRVSHILQCFWDVQEMELGFSRLWPCSPKPPLLLAGGTGTLLPGHQGAGGGERPGRTGLPRSCPGQGLHSQAGICWLVARAGQSGCTLCWTQLHHRWSPIAVAVGPANKSQSRGPLWPPPG